MRRAARRGVRRSKAFGTACDAACGAAARAYGRICVMRAPRTILYGSMHFATLTVTYQTEHNLGTALELHITIELVTHAW